MEKENVICTYSGMLFTTKKKEILLHVATWMNVEDIMLNKISHRRTDCMIPLMGNVCSTQTHQR